MLVVEALFHYYARECLFADLHLKLCAKLGIACIYKCHTYRLVGRNSVIAGSNLADLFALVQNFVAMAWNATVAEFDAYHPLAHAVGLLLYKSLLADEFGFVKLAEHA